MISSHILSEISLLADDIGIIDHGALLEEESLAELEQKAANISDLLFLIPHRQQEFWNEISMKTIFHTGRPQSAPAQPGAACGENCNCLCGKRIGGIGGAYL